MATLPTPEYTFGRVVGRIIRSVANPLQLWTNMGAVIPGTA